MLGTFGMYFREVRSPTESEIQLIEYAGRIAGITIERERSQTALNAAFEDIKKSVGQLRQMVDAIPQTIVVLGPDGSVVYVNRTVLDYRGLSTDDLRGADFRERVFHPEDMEKLRETRRKGCSRGTLWVQRAVRTAKRRRVPVVSDPLQPTEARIPFQNRS